MSKGDREKASDVFAKTDFLIGKKVTFSEAFPDIEDIKVVVERLGYDDINALNKVVHLSKSDVGEYVNCTNTRCYNGGVSVGNMVRFMIRGKETHFEDTRSCQGYEGSPKGRRRDRSCMNSFAVVIDIQYKKASSL